MNTSITWVLIAAAILFIGGGVYFASRSSGDEAMMQGDNDAMMEGDTAMQKDNAMIESGGAMIKDDAMMSKGSYEAYSPEKLALANEGKVALFFHATWCPTCKAIEKEIIDGASIPAGVHILKVDYDTATALRQKYGVTVQHTFVQVDASGNALTKFSDASTLSQALSKLK